MSKLIPFKTTITQKKLLLIILAFSYLKNNQGNVKNAKFSQLSFPVSNSSRVGTIIDIHSPRVFCYCFFLSPLCYLWYLFAYPFTKICHWGYFTSFPGFSCFQSFVSITFSKASLQTQISANSLCYLQVKVRLFFKLAFRLYDSMS